MSSVERNSQSWASGVRRSSRPSPRLHRRSAGPGQDRGGSYERIYSTTNSSGSWRTSSASWSSRPSATRRPVIPGGSLSAAEILTALFFKVMRIDPARPGVGRSATASSSPRATRRPSTTPPSSRRGYFPEEMLQTYDELDSLLQAHPDMHCPGVDMSSGSLGQGLSVGLGMALGARLKGSTRASTCCSATASCRRARSGRPPWRRPSSRLDNLVAIVDDNHIQLMGDTADIMPIDPVADKWRAFNWNVLEVDGHDVPAIVAACAEAARTEGHADGHHRAHGQGQGRLVHGEHPQVALGPGHRGSQGEGPRRAVREGGSADGRADGHARRLRPGARRARRAATSASWRSTPTWRRPARWTCSRRPTPSASSRSASPSRT